MQLIENSHSSFDLFNFVNLFNPSVITLLPFRNIADRLLKIVPLLKFLLGKLFVCLVCDVLAYADVLERLLIDNDVAWSTI